MTTKICHVFRTCEPGRKPPTSTLAILTEDSFLFTIRAHSDVSAETETYLASSFEIVPCPPLSDEQPYPTGTIDAHGIGGDRRTWHFFKELPVTGERIIQTIASMSVSAKVSTTEKK